MILLMVKDISNMIKKLIVFLFIVLFCYSSFATMPSKEIIKFKKLPEGSKVLMVIFSVENDNSKVLYGQIQKDIMDNNYLKCFDVEKDCWRLIYPNEKEAIEYFMVGEHI